MNQYYYIKRIINGGNRCMADNIRLKSIDCTLNLDSSEWNFGISKINYFNLIQYN